MCGTSFHVCYYGSPHQGGPYQSLTGSCLLLYHLFHSLFCTIDVPMYTAGESVFYRRSDGSLVPATVLGPGAQSETVQIEYKRNERLVRHPAALIANLSRPIPTIPDSPEWDRGSTDRNSGWCITGRRVSRLSQLNSRSSHARWKAHYSPVSCDSLLWCSFVNVVNCGKGEGMHVLAQRAGKFFFRGTGLPTAVCKNQPLVPRSNLGGKVCARTNPWFRGQTLLVLGHGGGGGGVAPSLSTSTPGQVLALRAYCARRGWDTHPRIPVTCLVAWRSSKAHRWCM